MARGKQATIAGLLVAVVAGALIVLGGWPDPAAGALRALDPASSGTSEASADPAHTDPTAPESDPATPQSSAPANKNVPGRTAVPSGSAPTEQPQSGAAAEAALSDSLAALFGNPTAFSAAALDLTTGGSIQVGATSDMTEASVMKVDLLQTLLYQQQQQGTPLTDDADTDATEMIENSDNDAADEIFSDVDGNSGLAAYNQLLGLSATALDPNGSWGLSTTSAADQLRLLGAITSASSPLDANSRSYALGLMGQVESDQDWGISAAADPGAQTALKNGWLDVDSDDGLWTVNSSGITTVDGHRLLLVVLSQHQPDYQTGVNRVQTAAVQLAAAVN